MRRIAIILLLLTSVLFSQNQFVWEKLFPPFTNSTLRQIAVDNSNRPFVVSGSDIYSSSDYGDTWEKISDGMKGYFFQMAIIDSMGSFILTSTHLYQYFVSSSYLKELSSPLSDHSNFNITVAENNIVLFEKENKVWYYSSDGGNSWVEDTSEVDVAEFFSFRGQLYLYLKDGNLYHFQPEAGQLNLLSGIDYEDETKFHYSENNIYCEKESEILISQDGVTWETVLIPEKAYFAVDKYGAWYSVFNSEYFRSTDKGSSWEKINLAHGHSSYAANLYNDVKFVEFEGLRRCNTINPYIPEEKQFIKLHVGNSWIYHSGSSAFEYSSEGFSRIEVTGDTVIDNHTYYFLNNNSRPYRYDESTKQLFVRKNEVDLLMMDFSQLPSTRATFYDAGGNEISAIIEEEYYNYDGKKQKLRGFRGYSIGIVNNYYGEYGWEMDSWSYYSMPYSTHYSELVESKVFNESAGKFDIISKNYSCSTSVYAKVESIKKVIVSLLVTHPYDMEGSFVEEAKIYYGYKSGQDVVNVDSIIVDNFTKREVKEINITPNLDYLQQGFQLCYKVTARDEGLSQRETKYPLIGYKAVNIDSSLIFPPELDDDNNPYDTTSSDQTIYSFGLEQNYPNPFNSITKITYSVPGPVYVELVIYDMLGNELERYIEGGKNRGTHTFEFDADNLPSGVYFYRVFAGAYIATQKMMLLK